MTTQVSEDRRRVSSPLHNFNFHVSEVGHQDLSAMWYFCDVFGRIWQSPFILFYLLAFWVAPAFLHPQCLDFKPPFQPQQELQFCHMYKFFGCCDNARDQELMAKYYRIMDNFDYYGYSNCASYVQDLLCQVSLVDGTIMKRYFYLVCCFVNVLEPLLGCLSTRTAICSHKL